MRTLAEYRDMHAKAHSLKVFRPVLTHITKKKEVTDDHKVRSGDEGVVRSTGNPLW